MRKNCKERISIIGATIILIIISMYTCKKESEYEKRLEQEQLNEMKEYHSSKGTVLEENGLLIIRNSRLD